ncbi:type IV secretory system conjugative DNA transfer family protein [Plantactinospora siamensis]|uniref:Type IV secretory system conjugative DNA transfer family protein n=1 Tax=Plantactinospora siamensis TaxID=555372 RepID=A0ABV6P2L5_9ACTN
MDYPPLPPFEVRPRRQVYLGLDVVDGHQPCWSAPADSVGVVAPPGYGHAAGLLVPTLMHWDGAVLCAGTRDHLLRAAGDWRRRVAARRGGDLYVYDPFAARSGPERVRWSPLAGCADPAVAYRRAWALVSTTGSGDRADAYRGTAAAALLRGLLHAAALARRDAGAVLGWLAGRDLAEPVGILERAAAGAAGWSAELAATARLADPERSAAYGLARHALDAMAEPRVRDATAGTTLDLDGFLESGSTLFVVCQADHRRAAVPLVAALVDAIVQRATDRAGRSSTGRIDPGLLLVLDDLPAVAPVESLPALLAEGGERGIVTLWAAQSLAALRGRYGRDGQQAIVTASTAKALFGGLCNGDDLRDVSGWAGEFREARVSYSSGRYLTGALHRPVLPVETLQQLPPGRAWLFYRSDPPLLVEARPAELMEPYRVRSGFTTVPARAQP